MQLRYVSRGNILLLAVASHSAKHKRVLTSSLIGRFFLRETSFLTLSTCRVRPQGEDVYSYTY